MADLSFAEVDALLKYDPETGKLFWKKRPVEIFASKRAWSIWNARYSDKEAFTYIGDDGYRQGAIFNTPYKAHRVIWLISSGAWPNGQIDHINGNRTDNRIENLRDVSLAENRKNQCISSRNTSGATGVCWSNSAQKWRAEIKRNGRSKFLGHFNDFASAHSARRKAEAEYGFHPNHGRPQRVHK